MEQIIKPLFFFSNFGSLFRCRLKSKAVLENFYPLAIFGHVCGFLPIKNILPKYRKGAALEFAFFSYPVLYSLVLNAVLYFFTFEASYKFYKESVRFKFSTDDFALKVFFGSYSLAKISIHFCVLFRTTAIIKCFQSINNYDSYFGYENDTLILNRYVAISFVGTIISATLSIVATFASTWNAVIDNFEQSSKPDSSVGRFWSLIILPEPLMVTILGLVTHVAAESAIFFWQSTIAYIVNCICDRIKAIEADIIEIHEKVESHEYSNEQVRQGELERISDHEKYDSKNKVTTIWIQPPKLSTGENFVNELKANLRQNSRRFLKLMDVVQDLNSVASEIIIIFAMASTVIIVSLCYLIVMFFSQWDDDSTAHIIITGLSYQHANGIVASTIILIVVLTIGRLTNCANSGEKLQNSVIKLCSTIKKFNHTDNAEVNRYCCYLWYLTSSADASLSGCGFFRLNRAALTSVLAPVITFIVILAQFRLSDVQLSSATNTTRV